MSSPTRRGSTSPISRTRADQDSSPAFLPPLKPRPKLLLILAVVLIAWLIFLVALRLKTVHHDTAPPIKSDSSSVG